VFVDGAGEILSMPPIINSHKTGKITEQTKEIFIECSGLNLNVLKTTLNILVTMFADMGGKIYQMKLKYDKPLITPDLTPEKMKINLEDCNKLLGLELKENDVKKYLEKMGFNYQNKQVEIPAWRTDILHPVDIYEDIAIGYGYHNITPEIPEISTIGEEDKKQKIINKVTEILTGLGLQEISTLHLLRKQDLKKTRQKSELEVEKSKTDYTYLRQNLITSLLKTLSENTDSEYPQKIFEIGTVFIKDEKQETGIKETENLILGITPGNFTDIKQVLDYLGQMLDTKLTIKQGEAPGLIEGRTGKISYKDKEIGIIGEVHPSLLNTAHLKMPLVLAEIDLELILKDLA